MFGNFLDKTKIEVKYIQIGKLKLDIGLSEWKTALCVNLPRHASLKLKMLLWNSRLGIVHGSENHSKLDF